MYGAFTLSGWLSQNHSITPAESRPRSEPQHARTLVWALSLSLAATQEIEFSFSSSGYLDVSVHRVPLHTLWIGVWIPEVFSGGFPHSEISGSMDICSSPKLIAAYHVFHRLLVPRHPPCALFCLASSDVIALTPDGLLVFFLSLLSQRLVFVSILRLTYHQEMNVLHMRFSRYSAQQDFLAVSRFRLYPIVFLTDVLSAIRRYNPLYPLITGKTSYPNSASPLM